MFVMQNYKSEFPIFEHNPELIYLDSSATNQRPRVVINAISDYYTKYNSNVHRGLYPISIQATEKYDAARKSVSELIGAEFEEIVFTGGATDALNGLATSLYKSGRLQSGDRVLLTPIEHHSNILPWQALPGIELKYFEVTDNFELDFENSGVDLQGVKLLTLPFVSNVTGTLFKAAEIIEWAKSINPGIIIVVDAAQGLSHHRINVKELGVDFMVFSGHKSFGPTGVGVLYGKKELLQEIEPYRYGGGMISDVSRESTSWAGLPEKFEAGTPNIAQVIGMGAAVEFIKQIGIETIEEHEKELNIYAADSLEGIDGLELFHPTPPENHSSVFSFHIPGIHPHDIAEYLGNKNICIRAGHHCTQILHKEILEVPATSRISLALYNTKEDIDQAVTAIQEAIRLLK